MKTPRIRLGKRGILKQHGWMSAFIQPYGKIEKRRASRAARRCKDISDGTEHKKTYCWFEWS